MKSNSQSYWGLVGINLVIFTGFIDYTILNTALPTIQTALSLSITQLQWLPNLYLISLAILMATTGKLGDIFGLKRIFFLGAVLFLISSLVCGLASNAMWLFIGRFLQGVGGSMIFPTAAALISYLFTDEAERLHAMSVYSMVNGVGTALGPTLGGFIVMYLSWRWIFLINVPIIAMGLLVLLRYSPNVPAAERRSLIDYRGMLLLGTFIGAISLGFINAAEATWLSHQTLLYFFVAVVALVLLLRVEKTHSDPLFYLDYFKRPRFIVGVLCCILNGIVVNAVLFFAPLYLQTVRHDSSFVAGLVLLSLPVMTILIPPLISKYTNKIGKIVIILVGSGIGALGILMQATFQENMPLWYVVVAFGLIGSSWAVANMISAMSAHDAVTPQEYGIATGIVFSTFCIFGSISLALMASLFHVIQQRSQDFLTGFHAVMGTLFFICLFIMLIIYYFKPADEKVELIKEAK